MSIKNIPATYEEFEQYNRDYEREYFVYSDTNQRVGESTVNLFLGWFPKLFRPVLKPCVYAIFSERALAAFGWATPPVYVRNLVEISLKLRGYFARLLLPRSQPDFYTDSDLRSYPNGYELTDLCPVKMLKTLNNQKIAH